MRNEYQWKARFNLYPGFHGVHKYFFNEWFVFRISNGVKYFFEVYVLQLLLFIDLILLLAGPREELSTNLSI